MVWARRVWLRLQTLFRRDGIAQKLDDEIQFHLEEQLAENIAAGMSREEARYAAMRTFGNPTVLKQETRETWGWIRLEQIAQDIRYGARTLRKSPVFTLVVILTLGLGIGANTAIFSLIDAVMLRMLPVEKPHELLQVKIQDPRWAEPRGAFTNLLWEQLRDHQDVFSNVFAWSEDRFDLSQGGAVDLVHGMWVSGDLFDALGLRPTAGRLIEMWDDHPGCPAVAMLNYGFWQSHYGGASSAIGSTLSLNRHSFQVIGVAPRGFNSMDQGERFDVAVPICATRIIDGDESRLDAHIRARWWLQVAGRAKPGIDQSQRIAQLKALSPGILAAAVPLDWPAYGQHEFVKRTLTAVPVATGSSQFGLLRRFERPLEVLMVIVGLVMVIACANIASLMLARAATRHKEIAVRKALGASPLRLICQLLTECILLSSAGALAGILFARWGAALLVRYVSIRSNAFFVDLSPDVRVLGFTAIITLLCAMLFGLLPALQCTRVSLTSAMKGSQALEIERPLRFPTRKWIVASQVALSLVLLVAAGLLLRSFEKLSTLDIGFDQNNVLLVGVDLKAARVPPDRRLVTYEAMENRLRALPGVVSVSRSMITPMEGGAMGAPIRTDWSKGLTTDEVQIWFNSVSPGYFETLRTPLLDGRDFTAGDTETGPKVAIINQALARRFFPDLSPIGRTFRVNQPSGQPGPPIEVVGLVKDAKYQSVREATHPTAFFPDTQAQFSEVPESENFELRTVTRPSALVSVVQAAIAEVNKEIPLDFHTLAQQVSESLVRERLLALLSGFFGVLAVLLAMIGLYGTLSYLVSQRQTEFSIRRALGAQPGSILNLVIGDLVVILGAGVAAGMAISLAIVRVLQDLLFGLPARDVGTLTAATCVLSGVALVAGYLPARRAMRVDPMVALRYE